MSEKYEDIIDETIRSTTDQVEEFYPGHDLRDDAEHHIHFITLNFHHIEAYNKRFEIIKYLIAVGGYGYRGLQGHDYSYGRNCRIDTSSG